MNRTQSGRMRVDWLAARCRATPHKPYLHLPGETYTFAQVDALTRRVVARLRQHGVAAGDHVALLLPNGLEFVLCLLALMRLRAVAVPLNTRLTRGELDWQLRNADCKLLIGARESMYATATQALAFPALTDLPPAEPGAAQTLDLNADGLIVHTSGTSGRPKAAVLTWGNLLHSAVASAFRLGVLPGDRWLCVMPMYHVGGLSIVLRSLIYGTAIDLLPLSSFDIAAVNRCLSDMPITLVSLTPTMLSRLLDGREREWNPRLRCVLLGGAATPVDLVARCLDAGIPIAVSYGLSEAASQVATALPVDLRQKPGSVGKPLLFTDLRVVDERGQDMPVSTPGELLVKGPTVMRGYRGRASALEDGWLRTGDIGYLDADGDLFVLQRREDLIISGGENIYPAEVEAVLLAHPAVDDAVALGLPDDDWGQRVAAAIQLAGRTATTTDDIIAFARERLAGYKIPRDIRFVSAMPRTPSGKIRRRDLRRLFDD